MGVDSYVEDSSTTPSWSKLLDSTRGLADAPAVDSSYRGSSPALEQTEFSAFAPWEEVRVFGRRLPVTGRVFPSPPPSNANNAPVLPGLPSEGASLHLFPDQLGDFFRFPDGSKRPYRMVFLRDQAAWCPFSQQCWILLEELRINYLTIKVGLNWRTSEVWQEVRCCQEFYYPLVSILISLLAMYHSVGIKFT